MAELEQKLTDAERIYVKAIEEEIAELRARLASKEAALSTIIRFVEASRNGAAQEARRNAPRAEWKVVLLEEIKRQEVISRSEMTDYLEEHEHEISSNVLSTALNELRKADWIEHAGERGVWRFISESEWLAKRNNEDED
jgi:hypothetical protein